MAAQYLYKAVNADGQSIEGTLEANSTDHAESLLFERGLMVVRMQRQTSMSANRLWSRLVETSISHNDLILFNKQFRTLFNAGVSMTPLLRVLEQQTENKTLKRVTADIARRVNAGSSLHRAFTAHADTFPPLYRAMLQAGEESGNLGDVLEWLTVFQEHEHRLRNNIASALRYPQMVLAALIVSFVVLLNVVLPEFIPIFSRFKIELPWPTQIAFQMNAFFAFWWPAILIGLGTMFLVLFVWVRTPKGRLFRDRCLLCIPLVGSVLHKAVMARFSFLFALLQRSGIGMMETIRILADSINNAVFEQEFVAIREKLRTGQGLARPFGESRYFSPLATSMIAIGEQSGSLDRVLYDLARHYDEEVTYAVDRMTRMLGPILLLLLSGLVGFFALAVFLPLWDMMKIIS